MNDSNKQDPSKSKPYDIHTGHRLRLKNRFVKEGLSGFEDHQILELVLFTVIPRKDTNPLAHELLKRFGSLAAVFDASIEELMSVKGVGLSVATHLKTYPAVFRQYELSRDNRRKCYDTLAKIGNYARKLFIGATVEQLYLIMFNNRLQIIDVKLLATGTVNRAVVSPRMLVDPALAAHASCVVLVHNHPYGNTIPSRDDISFTHVMESACSLVDIQFLDHLVVAGNDFSSILRTQKGFLRNSPMTGKPDEKFYRKFYDSN